MAGNDQGGGGAGICISNKCMTLAEAGFRLVPEQMGKEISNDVLAEVGNILKLLPSSNLTVSKIIGERGDIKFVTTANEKTVKKFLQNYNKVLQSNNGSNLSENLQIIGFTVKENIRYAKSTTYIINDKFEQLSSVRSKALLLIHEFTLRVYGYNFIQALALDGAIIDYLNARESNDWNKIDLWYFLNKFYDLENAHKYMIGDLLHRMGPMDSLVLFDSNDLELTYSKILENRKYDSRFSKYFSPTHISGVKLYSRGSLIENYIARIMPEIEIPKYSSSLPEKTVVFTKENFAEYIKSVNENAEIIKLLKNCKNASDEVELLHSVLQEDGLHRPVRSSCSTWSKDEFTNYIFKFMSPYLEGLELNIPGKLVCTYLLKYLDVRTPECRFVK